MGLCPVAHATLVGCHGKVFVIFSYENLGSISPAYEIEVALALTYKLEEWPSDALR